MQPSQPPAVATVETKVVDDDEIEKEYQRLMLEAQRKTAEAVTPLATNSEEPDFRNDINEVKKTLKRIVNKRSLAVAAQLSGDHQDALLHDFTKVLSKVEADISHLLSLSAQCVHKIKPEELRSQVIRSQKSQLDIAFVIPKLESKREELKEAVSSTLVS